MLDDDHLFTSFFSGEAHGFLQQAIAASLSEDGPDITTLAIFDDLRTISAEITAQEHAVLAGLPIVPLVLEMTEETMNTPPLTAWEWKALAEEGAAVAPGTVIGELYGPARLILRAERIILNFLTHLSGIASLTAQYAHKLEGTGVTLLDTRKTLPGLRYPEKYAVLVGGGHNHRLNLGELVLLKDNHIDAAGSITLAVEKLRSGHLPCPPIEVECRTRAEVEEAVACNVDRIMLDNMDIPTLGETLPLIPEKIKAEISGGINLKNIREHALASTTRRPDFISVGRITHSAPSADFSMRFSKD